MWSESIDLTRTLKTALGKNQGGFFVYAKINFTNQFNRTVVFYPMGVWLNLCNPWFYSMFFVGKPPFLV